MTPLSLTDRVVLGLLSEQPRHGFDVARELKADGPIGQIWTVHRPLVYRAIDHLADAGLILATRTEPGDQGPDRTIYRPTREGRTQHARWLGEPVVHPRDARVELLVKFVFLARARRPLAPLAAVQLEHFAPMIEGLERTTAIAVGVERIIALWRLETIRATTRLLEQVIEDEHGSADTAPRSG